MSVYTNGTRLCYYDQELHGCPVFCSRVAALTPALLATLHGKIVAVTPTLEEAVEVVNQGVTNYKRFVEAPPRDAATLLQMNSTPSQIRHDVQREMTEFKRKAHAKFPDAFLF